MKSAISFVALAGIASIASAVVPTVNIGNYVLNGDFVAAGGSSRTSSGVPNPFDIAMPGISGAEVRSYAVWNMLTNTPFDSSESIITINGNRVVAVGSNAATPDLCWGLDYTATYWADVTGLLIHGGNNTIFAGDTGTGALGEGVSLLTVYSDAAMPLQNIDIFWNGVPGQIANNLVDGENLWNFSNPYIGGPAHGFTNALDGQLAGDDFYINGGLASGQFGTFAPFDAWIGNVGPYYDHAEGDFSPFMVAGDTFMTIGTPILDGDCIGHTFGAIAFVIPAPGTIALAGMGVLAFARRRR